MKIVMMYVYYLENNCTIEKMYCKIVELLPNCQQIIDKVKWLKCDSFLITVDKGSQHIIHVSEDYGAKFKIQILIEIFGDNPARIEKMLGFVGYVMKSFDGNCILESNGEIPIVMRKENIVIVDDKKLRGETRFPFHYLGIEYRKGDLEMI